MRNWLPNEVKLGRDSEGSLATLWASQLAGDCGLGVSGTVQARYRNHRGRRRTNHASLERRSQILSGCKHIKPTIYTDKELTFVREEDCPGYHFVPGKARRSSYGIRSARPSARRDHLEARSRWRDVSSARNQNQHANSIYIGIFRTGLRILECSSRKTASGSHEVQRSTPKEAKEEVLICSFREH